MPHLIALDQGTTSSRAIVYDDDLRPVASAQRAFTQHFPRPGWVEHDPTEIATTQLAVAAEALESAGLTARDVAAIGITNQRETVVAWERATGSPIGRAIVWQDRRTAAACDRLVTAGFEPLVRERSGLVVDAYFSGPKIQWMLDHVDGLRARAESGDVCFGTIDSWLVACLTGHRTFVTDPTNAGRTMLCDIRRGTWDPDLLDALDVPAAALAEIVPTSGPVGRVACGHVLDGVPITALVGDQQAALHGQVGDTIGPAKCTYGTGCFALVNTGATARRSAHGLLTTPARTDASHRTFALEGSVFIGGALVQWLRDGLGLIESADDIEALARSVPDPGDVMLVPAFSGLGTPYWDARARGTIIGLTRGTTRGHIARAALEGIAHSVTDLLDVMGTDAGSPVAELRVDGGACRNDLLMQMQADLLGVPVIRPADIESTALGAARLAARGLGDDPRASIDPSARPGATRFEPAMATAERRRARDRWRDAVRRAGGWAQDDAASGDG